MTNAEDSSDVILLMQGDSQPLFRPKTLEDENDELADQANHLRRKWSIDTSLQNRWGM